MLKFKISAISTILFTCSSPLSLQPEPPGANCAQGGVQVSSGENVAFVCNGETGARGEKGDQGNAGPQGSPGLPGGSFQFGSVLEGSFLAANQADMSALANVTTITGNVSLSANGFDTINLPNLTTVQGQLAIVSGQDLVQINLPNLATVGKLAILGNPLLPTCQGQALADQLTVVPSGGVTISGNDDLGTCP